MQWKAESKTSNEMPLCQSEVGLLIVKLDKLYCMICVSVYLEFFEQEQNVLKQSTQVSLFFPPPLYARKRPNVLCARFRVVAAIMYDVLANSQVVIWGRAREQ